MKVSTIREGSPPRAIEIMVFGLIFAGMLGGIAGLVIFELFQEAHGAADKLRDRYHQ